MTLLGKILAALNVVAALAFATLLLMDYGKRQSWSYAIFLADVGLQGLPLENDNLEERGQLLPKLWRQSDTALPHDRILSQHLDEPTLKLVFAGAGEPVKTLEEEVRKLQGRLPSDIDNAVTEVAGQFGNTDPEKRNGLYFVLLPLARTGPQIDALKAKIDKSSQAALDALVQEAVRRHLLNDLLDPLQQLSPAAVKDDLTPHIAALDAKGNFTVAKEKLDEFLAERLKQVADPNLVGAEGQGAKWDRDARRQLVADLIFAVAHLTKPGPNDTLATALLNETGPARAQVVLGLIDYNAATDRFADALTRIAYRIVRAIERDRDGVKGQLPGFVGNYREQLAVMRRLAEDVLDRKGRLDHLTAERKKVEDDLAERRAHQDALVKKILEGRAETLRLARQLRQMQQQLFVAQRESTTAFEDNLRMLNQIRELEGLKKGAQ